MSTPEIVRDLLRPEAYPWRPDMVDRVETHVSWVFLAGDRVVKIKRPVDLGFVDHTTLEARRQSCEDEVRLNRRLTDGVYLGMVPIARENDELVVDGPGEPVEWATLMRRLPADRMLDALLETGAAPHDVAERLADRLVGFHQHGSPQCGGTPEQQANDAMSVVIDNLDELQPLMVERPFGAELGMIDAAVRTFVTEREDLLLQRARDGWIREGHGDLRAEHICLEQDGAVQVFDCVEFSKPLRCADVASDLAFLLMDLDRLGASRDDVGHVLVRYRDAGVDLPPALVGLYWIHRALVRAKVDAIRMAESNDDDDSALLGDVAGYLHTAVRHAIACRPAVIAMTGLSGTGKSTVARLLARVLGADVHRSDAVRKSLSGTQGPASSSWQSGIYSEAWSDATYDRMFELGAHSVTEGHPVILDAAFLDSDRCEEAATMAREHDVSFVLIETTCDEDVLLHRLEERAARKDDPSDADVAIYRQQQASIAEKPVRVPEGGVFASVDATPEQYIDLDPALIALRDAGVIMPRVSGEGLPD